MKPYKGIIVLLQHEIHLTRCYPINRLLCAFAFLGAMEASNHLDIDNAHVVSYNRHSERLSDIGKLGKISCDRSCKHLNRKVIKLCEGIILFFQHELQLTRFYPILSCAFAFLGAMEASDHLYIDNARVVSYY